MNESPVAAYLKVGSFVDIARDLSVFVSVDKLFNI